MGGKVVDLPGTPATREEKDASRKRDNVARAAKLSTPLRYQISNTVFQPSRPFFWRARSTYFFAASSFV